MTHPSVNPPHANLKAVLFDAYGTLAFLAEPRQPYRRLLYAATLPLQARALLRQVMRQPLSLVQVAQQCGVPEPTLAQAEADLALELASLRLYPDTLPTLQRLREQGYRLGLCSNLAQPYAEPLQALLPPLDAAIWSFKVGAVKPEPQIYAAACAALACLPHEVLMVGDSYKADVAGPRAFGLQAAWLRRGAVHSGDMGDLGPYGGREGALGLLGEVFDILS